MAKKNEAKIKFTADTAGFNDAIKKANSEMAELRAELKLNETQAKNNGKSIESLEQKHKILSNQLEASQSKTEALNQKINKAVEIFGEESEEVSRLRVQLTNALTAEEKLNQAINKCNAELQEQRNAMQDTRTAAEKLSDTITEQENELAKLKRQYSDYVLEGKEATQEAKNLESAISKLSSELKENKSSLSKASDKADELAGKLDNVEEEAEQAGSGFTIMKDAIGDLVADGVQVAIDAFGELMTASSEASASLQAQIGATTKEMQAYNDEMEELYANNYGENLQDIADKMAYVKHVTGEVDPSKLRELTENTIALEDTFGSDFNETIRGVTNMMQHFGIDSEEAFDLFAKGSQEGLDYTGELGDNIAEYGGNFAQAGYTAQEYFQLLKNGAEGGAYNLDKVNDSINEAKNRLGDGSIAKSIDVFSTGTQDVFKEWQNGNATMKDVIDSMVNDITLCENETKALTMAQVAFGTMGEDANLDVVRSLKTVGYTFDDVKGTMESVKEVKYSDVGSQFSQIGRMIKTDLVQPIADLAMPAIEGIANFIIDNFPIVGPIIAGVAGAFTVLAGALAISTIISGVQKAMSLLNITLLANPVVLIVAGITALVVAFIGLWNNCESFRNFWIGLWEGIKNVCSTAWEGIKSFFSAIPEWFNTNIIQPVVNFFTGLWSSMKGIWDSICNVVSFAFELIGSIISAYIQIITLPWRFIWENCKEYIFQAWEWIKEKVSIAINAVSETISTVMNAIKDVFTTVWTAIKDFFEPILEGFKNAVSTAWEAIKTATSSVFNSVKSVVSSVWNGIKSTVSSIVDGVKNKVSTVWNSIKSVTSSVWNGIKSTTTSVWNGIKTAILTPIETAKTKIKGIIDAIKGFFTNCKLSFPNIKLPHFSVEPKGWKVDDLLKGKIPKLSISWHADGGIFTKPTLLNNGTSIHGVGEAGPEAILPIDRLQGYIENAIVRTQQVINFDSMANAIEKLADRAIELKINDRIIAETTASASDNVNGLRNTLISRGLILE